MHSFSRPPGRFWVGALFLLGAFLVWMIPQISEQQTFSNGNSTRELILMLDANTRQVAHIIMLALLSLGITIIFVSMFGANILIDLPSTFLGKGSVKIGNAAGFLAIVFSTLYLTTNNDNQQKINSLNSEISNLKKDLEKEKIRVSHLQPFEKFFDFISSGTDHATGFTIKTQIGRKESLGSIEADDFFNVSLLDRRTLSNLIGSDKKKETSGKKQSYPISRNGLELYFYDVDREILISEMRIRVEEGLELKLDLFVNEAICIWDNICIKS